MPSIRRHLAPDAIVIVGPFRQRSVLIRIDAARDGADLGPAIGKAGEASLDQICRRARRYVGPAQIDLGGGDRIGIQPGGRGGHGRQGLAAAIGRVKGVGNRPHFVSIWRGLNR